MAEKKKPMDLNEQEKELFFAVRDRIQEKRVELYKLDEKSKEFKKARREYKRFTVKEMFDMTMKFIQMDTARGVKYFIRYYPKFIWDFSIRPWFRKVDLIFENTLFVLYHLCAIFGIVVVILTLLKKVSFNF